MALDPKTQAAPAPAGQAPIANQIPIYAQILKGVVQNIIEIADASQVPVFGQGFDTIIEITNLDPRPQIGWLWDGQIFSPPLPSVPDVAPLQVPAMSTASRDLIAQTGGMEIYNSDTGTIQYWSDTRGVWVDK